MKLYSDKLTSRDIHEAFVTAGLASDGVYMELHGPSTARKRASSFVLKLSADPGADRFGTNRRWANSGSFGAQTPSNGYVGEPLGDKAATYDEWGVLIDALFKLDPKAVIGQYDTPADLARVWTLPVTTP